MDSVYHVRDYRHRQVPVLRPLYRAIVQEMPTINVASLPLVPLLVDLVLAKINPNVRVLQWLVIVQEIAAFNVVCPVLLQHAPHLMDLVLAWIHPNVQVLL